MAKKKQKINPWVICVGLVCLTVLECIALSQGMNGTVLKAVLVVIAGTIGWSVRGMFK